MHAIKYAQESGFTFVENIEDWLGFKIPNSWNTTESMLVEAGWARSYSYEKYPGTYSRHLCTTEIVIHANKEKDQFLVALDNFEESEWIIVEGSHNLMALKIALAPMVQMANLEALLSDIANTTDRAFSHTFDHGPDSACRECENRTEREDRQKLERNLRERSVALEKPLNPEDFKRRLEAISRSVPLGGKPPPF